MSDADVVIVGGGPAGLSVATALKTNGIPRVVVLEREITAGGIPRHCDHQGFGLRDLHRSLSGPRYAALLVARARRAGVDIKTGTTALSCDEGQVVTSSIRGIEQFEAHAVVLATGARERPRSARLVPGDRVPGIFTTGQLQNWSSLKNFPVGARALVVGAELVSYSAVMTLHHAGAKVVAMTTEFPRHQVISGAATAFRLRYGVELWTESTVVEIGGRGRVQFVVVQDASGTRRRVEVDTIVFTGSWIPDNELARRMGLELDRGTKGPTTDRLGQTSLEGVFAAGNLLHPVETADIVTRRSRVIGGALAQWIQSGTSSQVRLPQASITVGEGLEWIWPNRRSAEGSLGELSLRPSAVHRRATLTVQQNGHAVSYQSLRSVVPNRHLTVPGSLVDACDSGDISVSLTGSA